MLGYGNNMIESARILWHTAHQYYQLSEVLQAAQVFRKTLEVAESLDDPVFIVNCRRWCGAALYEGGKLREALAVLVPIIKESIGGEPEDCFVAMVKYVEIAQEIPVSSVAIQKAHTTLDHALATVGDLGWRHMQRKKLSEFYKLRGLYPEALQMAQESWMLFSSQRSGPSFLAEEYLYNLVHLCLLEGKFGEAKRLLTVWDNQDSTVPSYNEMTRLIRHSEFTRLIGNGLEAINSARRACFLAEQTRHYWRLHCSLHALARAFLCARKFPYAESILRRLAENRHSESLHSRYKFHLLRGDYYLAYARMAVGAVSFDDEFGVELGTSNVGDSDKKRETQGLNELNRDRQSESTSSLTDQEPTYGAARLSESPEEVSVDDSDGLDLAQSWSKQRVSHSNVINPLSYAEKAYRTANLTGRQIDRLLECSLREKEIASRFERLEAIKKIGDSKGGD
jgi:hypothetical protein